MSVSGWSRSQLGLPELECLLVQRDRLGRPARRPVSHGEVVAAGERVGVVESQRRAAHEHRPLVGRRRLVVQAQAVVSPAQRLEQLPLDPGRAGELALQLRHRLVQNHHHPQRPPILGRVGLAERLHQEPAHRLRLTPRPLRLLECLIGLRLGVLRLGQRPLRLRFGLPGPDGRVCAGRHAREQEDRERPPPSPTPCGAAARTCSTCTAPTAGPPPPPRRRGTARCPAPARWPSRTAGCGPSPAPSSRSSPARHAPASPAAPARAPRRAAIDGSRSPEPESRVDGLGGSSSLIRRTTSA